MQTKTCPGCGKTVPDDAITCKHCGTLFFKTDADMRTTDDPVSRSSAERYVRTADYSSDGEYMGVPDANSDQIENAGVEGENGVDYDYDYEDDADYADPVSARYKKTVIIVLSAIFVLLIVVIVLLFISKDDLSGFGKKEGAASDRIYTNYVPSEPPDSSSELDTLTELDSSVPDDSSSEEDEDESSEEESSEDDSSEEDDSSQSVQDLPEEYIPPQTQPTQTEPPQTEPPQTEPPQTEPSQTEPSQTEPEPEPTETTTTETPPLPEN